MPSSSFVTTRQTMICPASTTTALLAMPILCVVVKQMQLTSGLTWQFYALQKLLACNLLAHAAATQGIPSVMRTLTPTCEAGVWGQARPATLGTHPCAPTHSMNFALVSSDHQRALRVMLKTGQPGFASLAVKLTLSCIPSCVSNMHSAAEDGHHPQSDVTWTNGESPFWGKLDSRLVTAVNSHSCCRLRAKHAKPHTVAPSMVRDVSCHFMSMT